MNLLDAVKAGISGKRRGLRFGMPKLDKHLGGMQRGESFAWGAEAKVGKTAYVDKLCVINPYLYSKETKKKWIYFSFEIDRISKEAKYASHFMYLDYHVDVSDSYLLGKMMDDNGNLVRVTEEHLAMLEETYRKHIIPLFGEYKKKGHKYVKEQEGMIEFIEQRENPTGIRNHLLSYAKRNGSFINEDYEALEGDKPVTRSRIIGYEPADPELYTIVIVDHIRAMSRERGFSMKENIDKMSEYHVQLRNQCGFIFHFVSHLNRGIDVDRLKFMGDKIFPTSEDFKDSGNLAEDCTNIMTLFNPLNEKYNLRTHFGQSLVQYKGLYRSLHLVMARNAESPVHFSSIFDGKNLKIKEL